jgi:effector-binding domain-containing protein
MPAGAPIAIVDLAPRRFGAVRRRTTLDASTDMAAAAPVWSRILAKGVPFGLPVLVFHDAAGPALFEEPGVEVDLGFELFADIEDPIVVMADSPAGRAVRLDHYGAHMDISASHQAIRDYCATHGLETAGPVVEIHHWNDDADRRITEIYYLLA